MSSQSPLFKVQVCLYKKDDTSYDEFIQWATEVYPVKAIPLMKSYGMVKWTTTQTPPHFRQAFRHALENEMGRPQWVVPDYDLVMTYYLRSLDDMTKLTTSAGWAELEVGAEKIANVSIGQLVIGHEVVQFEDNWAESAKADA